MKNVSFSYDGENEILKNVDLSIEQGKSYAIVGSSGSGKTTLLQMLMGYYNNYQGDILFRDLELRQLSLDSLYDVIGVIQQNVFLFDSTIKDNISMFKPVDESSFSSAIELSGLGNLIREKVWIISAERVERTFQAVSSSVLRSQEALCAMFRFYCWTKLHQLLTVRLHLMLRMPFLI